MVYKDPAYLSTLRGLFTCRYLEVITNLIGLSGDGTVCSPPADTWVIGPSNIDKLLSIYPRG